MQFSFLFYFSRLHPNDTLTNPLPYLHDDPTDPAYGLAGIIGRKLKYLFSKPFQFDFQIVPV